MSDKEKGAMNTSSSDKKAVAKSSDKKEGIFKRIGKFFKEYRAELKKISWPTFPEVVKNTIITLVVVLIIGAVIWAFDFGVSTLRDMVISSDKGDKPPVTDQVSGGDVSDGDIVIPPTNSDVTPSNGDAD